VSLAYAISIHKSQGSEFPVVIVPVALQHYMLLQKNLIYTAITRKKWSFSSDREKLWDSRLEIIGRVNASAGCWSGCAVIPDVNCPVRNCSNLGQCKHAQSSGQ